MSVKSAAQYCHKIYLRLGYPICESYEEGKIHYKIKYIPWNLLQSFNNSISLTLSLIESRTMSFPDREQRKTCWDSRDRYWECLDKQNIKDNSVKPKECLELRKLFEKSCPTQWVSHFDRKRDFNVFKEKMQKEGYDPIKEPQ